ncbi:MAG TPA: glutamyl-tRNA reductase [Bryobacteraceae bacterium]|nr:glutamyl-tRNA reductase [Bryobacteraceae bacterium]
MKLLVAGLSHKTAPVDLREQLAIPEGTLPRTLQELQKLGASEAVVLSTCNRVEFALSSPDDVEPGSIIDRFFADWRGSGLSGAFDGHLYRLEAREAIQHMFRVAASLDSMVVGEPQILGQLKAAYAVAKSEGTVGGLLETVMTKAFNVAKRVRSETGIGQMAVSVSYAAVELARQIFGSLKGHTVLIIGSGKMGELAAKHLRRSGANRILVTNRTWERAEEMAKTFDGRAVEYSQFQSILHEVDIVISSSGAPHYILTRDDMQRVIRQRRNKPIFLIDIAVPRNIDPAVNEIEGVILKDVDGLEGVVSANIQERTRQAEAAEKIVLEEVDRTMAKLRVEEIAPTIVSLQGQLEEIRAAEVIRTLRRMPGLTAEQVAQIEIMTKSIVNKIAHGPISELRRNAGQPEGSVVIEAIRRVFRIE